jgi:class 3 adenylate cyclase/tetratricopeptide (TPR) repeat protein
MFADVVGSTQLIAGLDPEQAMERLGPAVAIMCAAVQRFDGTVVRTLGDGIMALFGAPRAQEGHALLACAAALSMQAELSTQKEQAMVRVGLHSGDIVSGVPASDPTKEPGAYGVAVHVASRLQEIADPGGICLTEECYRLVRPYCDVRALGRRKLKGVPESIEIFSLLGLKPAVASQQFRGTNLTSFRGRDHEYRVLQHALASAESGNTRAVGISGSPGSGKSRLCYEFTEWCRKRIIPVMETRAELYGHATPLQLAFELLRLLFRILRSDDASVARHRIEHRVSALGPTFETDLPLLYEFLGIADEILPSNLDPQARYARLLDIVRNIILQDGAVASVVVIEDLHWLDDASEDFVAALVDAIVGTRILLVLNYRPSYVASWMKSPYFQELSLAELSSIDTAALVEDLIGSRPELLGIRQRVADRSGGNPFFAEELVRSLVDSGAVFGQFGDFQLSTRVGEAPLPATVETVIGARIDRLAEDEKAVLQIGAIIGKEFPQVVLQDVAGSFVPNTEIALGRLREAGLIQDQPAVDGRQFAFRHPLIQEVAYASQLKTRRSVLHALVARAMESFHRERLNEFAGLIAYHYEAAGKLAEAAKYEGHAAMWVGSTKPAQAIKHWQKVRLMLQNQPRSQENERLRVLAAGQVAWLGWREGMTADAAKPLIEEALALARETDDTMVPLLLFVDGRITVASGGSADYYVARVKEALSLLKPEQSAGRVATLNCALSQAYGWAGLLNDALSANDAALQGVSFVQKFDHQFLGYNVEHWIISLRGRIFARLGRFEEAEECFERVLRIEQALLDPTLRFIPHLGYVDLAWCRGDAQLAERHASRLAEIAEGSGSTYVRVYVFACAGTAKSLAKDFVGAVSDFIKGLEYVRNAKASVGYEPEILASLADCYFRMNELEQAVSFANEAIDSARKRCTRLPECRASITCAAALFARHGAAVLREADDLFSRAEDLIHLTGAKIYEPLLKAERARISTVVGRCLFSDEERKFT